MFEVKVTVNIPDLVMAATVFAKALRPDTQAAPAPTVVIDPQQGTLAVSADVATAATTAASLAAVPIAPTPTEQPSAPAPVAQPQAPATAAPTYDLNQLANAGAVLTRQGKVAELQALLPKYGVATISELDPSLYGAFATDLRGLGAQI